jgi:NADPH:quinone reductase
MRAVVVTRSGGPEVIEFREDEPDPRPGEGEVLVAPDAAGVNFRDIYERRGNYGGAPPLVAGVEGAGPIVEVGSRVGDLFVGQRVAWVSAPGSYAEKVVVPAARAVPVPEGISSEVAAAVLLQGMTAHYLSHTTYPVQPGESVVVHAAAGGVGLLLTQMVKLRGGRVIATTSNDAKAELARGAGADELIPYDSFGEAVRELTDGEGAAAVYDGVGQATFDESLAALRPRGTMVLYGSASGSPAPVDTARLGARSLFLTRASLGHYTATRAELLERAAAVFGWIADGNLTVRIGGRYPLAEARRAHEDLEGRRTTGKLILLPNAGS